MQRRADEKLSRWWYLVKLPLLIMAISTLLPYYWMVVGAFKTIPELLQEPPTFWIEKPTLQNFYAADYVESEADPERRPPIFQRRTEGYGFFHQYFNSLAITFTVTGISLLLASLVAFVLTKRPFPGSHALFNLLLFSTMVPWEVTIIPNFLTVTHFHWVNHYKALIFPVLAKSMAVFYFRQMIISIPNDLIDAAIMDGAGTLRIWWRIVLPILRPGLAAIGIQVAIGEWNSYLWPLLVVNDARHTTLPLVLGKLAGNLTFDPQSAGVLMAASLAASVPAIVAFLALQRQFAAGLAVGTSKG